MLAHMTGQNFEGERDHYIGDQLNGFQDSIAADIRESVALRRDKPQG